MLSTADNLAEKRNGKARMKKTPKKSATPLRRMRPLVKDGPASLRCCLKYEPRLARIVNKKPQVAVSEADESDLK